SGAQIVAMGLDVTTKVTLDEGVYERIKGMKESLYKHLLLDQLAFYIKSNLTHNGTMPHMHDPCTIAYLADPGMFSLERHQVHVETKGELTYGRTVTGGVDESSPVSFGVDCDSERFWSLFFRSVNNLK
ncbi:MAG: nucleoside hydrolase, partial [Bullifex sp.]